MTTTDFANIWNQRMAFDRDPSHLVPIYAGLVGRLEPVSFTDRYALDIGMGMGADARYLATRGFYVDALDPSEIATHKVSIAAKESNLPINTHTTSFEDYQTEKKYDVGLAVKILHFLTPAQQNSALLKLESMLKPKGHVIIRAVTTETQNATTQHPGLLQPGELYRRFSEWDIRYQKSVRVPCKNMRNEDSVQVFDDMIAQKRY